MRFSMTSAAILRALQIITTSRPAARKRARTCTYSGEHVCITTRHNLPLILGLNYAYTFPRGGGGGRRYQGESYVTRLTNANWDLKVRDTDTAGQTLYWFVNMYAPWCSHCIKVRFMLFECCFYCLNAVFMLFECCFCGASRRGRSIKLLRRRWTARSGFIIQATFSNRKSTFSNRKSTFSMRKSFFRLKYH